MDETRNGVPGMSYPNGNKSEDERSACSRRRFLKGMASAGAWAMLGGSAMKGSARSFLKQTRNQRIRTPNPFVNGAGKPILVCVEGTDFSAMLRAGMDALGGWGKLFTDNQDVLVKPNCNSIDTFPFTTSGNSMLGLIRELEAVTEGAIGVGDVGYEPTEQVYTQSGIREAVGQTRATLLALSDQNTYNVRHSDWDGAKPDYRVYKEIYDSPVIINFPNIKRHFLGKMSCAIKNNVGTVPGQGASVSRGYLHAKSGNDFLEELAEIAGLINPDLTIVDARSVLVGNGPMRSQDGAEVMDRVNKIILSGDMAAADLYCAGILEAWEAPIEEPVLAHFKASMIQATINRAHERGLGVGSLDEAEVIEISTTDTGESNASSPERFALSQNYPNPFNASTKIRYVLGEKARVRLDVYDISGKRVAALVDAQRPAGDHSVRFDADNLPSGSYVYRLAAGGHVLSRTMMLVR